MTTFGGSLELVPLSVKAELIQTRDSPRFLFAKVQEEFQSAFPLESATGAKRLAQSSFVGCRPQSLVSVKNGSLSSRSIDGAKDILKTDGPLRKLSGSPPVQFW